MSDSENFDTQKDINRYLSQQGRAPQSHMDWETWRKVGQPGTYQAPPGSPSKFRGVYGGGGGPNYNVDTNHYNMFSDLNETIEKTVGSVGMWAAKKYKGSRDGKMDKDKSGSTASSRNGSDMADDDGSMGPPVAGGGRSQNASITSPANSRGMRRGRRGDFSGALASHGITMVQGNDNFGTVYGNIGGANVGNGDYDASFQSKNSGGRQTAFSGNNSTFGGGSPTPPVNPTTPTPPPPPPTPPIGPNPPPTPPVGPTPPIGPGTPPKTPKTYVTDEDWEGIKRPPLTPTPPPQIGAPPVGPQTPVAGPQRPGTPAIGPGPQPAGAVESGIKGELEGGPSQKTLDKGDKIYGLARDPNTTPGERLNAQDKWHGLGFQGPFPSETSPGPQAPAPGNFKPQNDYMGIPTGASPSMNARAGAKVKGDQASALPQFARMAQASFAGGQPSAVQKSAGANSKPAPAKKAAAPKAKAEAVEGPKSVASRTPGKEVKTGVTPGRTPSKGAVKTAETPPKAVAKKAAKSKETK